jgi:hypothetical protein
MGMGVCLCVWVCLFVYGSVSMSLGECLCLWLSVYVYG